MFDTYNINISEHALDLLQEAVDLHHELGEYSERVSHAV